LAALSSRIENSTLIERAEAFKIRKLSLAKAIARWDLFVKNQRNWIGDYALEVLYE
jgi:hypothetical protein